ANRDPLGEKAADVGSVLHIGAAHGYAAIMQHLRDCTHADAADANDVDRLLSFLCFCHLACPSAVLCSVKGSGASANVTTRSASRPTASYRASDFERDAARASVAGSSNRRRNVPASRSGVMIACSKHQPAPAFSKREAFSS